MTLVTLTTDFGHADPFVGIMKGVIAARAPGVPVIDVTHGIPPQDVRAGALVLRHALPFFPNGSVHVAVVDPGVGGPRRPICVETRDALLVGPDNGLLSLAAPPATVVRIIHLTEERFFLAPRSVTFHGRDVFAPVAAALAAGTDPGVLGPIVADMQRIELPEPRREGERLIGEVLYVDRFGNAVTNVPETAFPRRDVSITIRGVSISGIAASYGAVAPGEPVAVVGSWGLVEVAVRDGSAAQRLGVRVGDPVEVARALMSSEAEVVESYVPAPAPVRGRWARALQPMLLVLTLLSTTMAGATWAGVPLREPRDLAPGPPLLGHAAGDPSLSRVRPLPHVPALRRARRHCPG